MKIAHKASDLAEFAGASEAEIRPVVQRPSRTTASSEPTRAGAGRSSTTCSRAPCSTGGADTRRSAPSIESGLLRDVANGDSASSRESRSSAVALTAGLAVWALAERQNAQEQASAAQAAESTAQKQAALALAARKKAQQQAIAAATARARADREAAAAREAEQQAVAATAQADANAQSAAQAEQEALDQAAVATNERDRADEQADIARDATARANAEATAARKAMPPRPRPPTVPSAPPPVHGHASVLHRRARSSRPIRSRRSRPRSSRSSSTPVPRSSRFSVKGSCARA